VQDDAAEEEGRIGEEAGARGTLDLGFIAWTRVLA
jgi:hypothetical protein